MELVSTTKASNYDLQTIKNAIDKHFELLNIGNKISIDSNVLIKPNLLMKRKPELGTTTHPSIVEAVVIRLIELGIKNITICDSPGGPFTKTALGGIYNATGMEDVAKRYNVNLNYNCGFTKTIINGKVMNSIEIVDALLNADYIINIAKLKTHAMTGLSGGVKNLFGVIPGLIKPELHFRYPEKEIFCEMLVDLASFIKPNLTIVDAVVSMEGDGPSAGILRQSNMIFAGENPFSIDRILCDYINCDPMSIYTVSHSVKRNLTPIDLNEFKIVGDGYEKIMDFKKAASKSLNFSSYVPKIIGNKLLPLMEKKLSPKPKVNMKSCIGCGKCSESCPAKIINIENKKAIINYDKCIKCFCCHEMCPVKAIKIVRFKLWKW